MSFEKQVNVAGRLELGIWSICLLMCGGMRPRGIADASCLMITVLQVEVVMEKRNFDGRRRLEHVFHSFSAGIRRLSMFLGLA